MLGRLARRTHRLSRRRHLAGGTSQALEALGERVPRDDVGPLRKCKISCRLHDGAVLGKRILRPNMRTPRARRGAPHAVA
ncbi:hypothetical protein SBD_2678 [Streptomyces bottropensis ATCC 25435]|uniref:Uncharacterized protein n=1 Tax=Streptomyces bottropensis ATCC 25435 TaxID=1054862 RepID=M3FQY9_9ACTN|nr:hypothetical protein SBD_2678 [Streptomyces bottropensis ATCC 25435]